MAQHTGKNAFERPQKDNHMHNFEVALKDALSQSDGHDRPVQITFQAIVSPNPGGVKEYRVIIDE
jgi:hypothetical protein